MAAEINPLAGKTVPASMLANIPRLVTAYFAGKPDPSVPAQRVAFGTSGHRGSAFNHAFNEAHILAISQALCDFRRKRGITGPLFIGIDTHALAEPALASARSRGAIVTRQPMPAVAFGGRRIAWIYTKNRLLIEYLER